MDVCVFYETDPSKDKKKKTLISPCLSLSFFCACVRVCLCVLLFTRHVHWGVGKLDSSLSLLSWGKQKKKKRKEKKGGNQRNRWHTSTLFAQGGKGYNHRGDRAHKIAAVQKKKKRGRNT